MVAGGNIAAALSYGDITAAGVGTATSVCGGRVVGFGHPMTFGGTTTLSLHPADALYVQEDSLGVPFKVANIGDPAGTITDDRLTGISGAFGALPETTTITSNVTLGDRSREGTTNVNIPAAGAEMTFNEHLANHDRVVDGIIGGTSDLSYTITGTDADGSPFEIGYSDQFQSNYDITFDSAFDAADIVFGLTSIEGVTVDDVSMTSRGERGQVGLHDHRRAAASRRRVGQRRQEGAGRRQGGSHSCGCGPCSAVRAGRRTRRTTSRCRRSSTTSVASST